MASKDKTKENSPTSLGMRNVLMLGLVSFLQISLQRWF